MLFRQTVIKTAALAAALLCLVQCTAIPNYFARTPAPAPAAAAIPLPNPRAGSPQLPPQRITLDEAIEIARRNNPSLVSGNWDIQTAAAQRNQAASARWPQFTTTETWRNYLQDQRLQATRANQEPGLFSKGILSADLVLKMPLFTGGQIRSDITAAEFQVLAAQNRLARTWEELIFNISSAFYNILAQRKVVESLRFSRNAMIKQRQRVLDMMSVDKAAKVDVLRTEVRLADLEQRLVREQAVLDIQRRLLTTLLGVDLAAGPMEVEGDLRLRGPVPDLNGALAMAYAERGDYRSALASLEAQAMKVNSARAARWPKLSLDGTIGMRAATGIGDDGRVYTDRVNNATRWGKNPNPAYAGQFNGGPIWPYPASVWPVGSLAVVAEYPLFTGGRIASQIDEQQAKLASAQAALRKLALQIRLDVETALVNVSSTRRRAQAMQKAIEQAKESFRIEEQKYEVGKGTITDVLDAQAAMLDAETNYYKVVADYNIAVAQLGLATGEKR
ncbi:MAG: TolC family protein [Desulfomonilaceae bacterium]